MYENFSEEIDEESYFYENRKWANYVALSFVVLAATTVLSIGLDFLRYIGVYSGWVNLIFSFCHLGSFLIGVIFYLIWYKKVNENFLEISNQNLATDYLGSTYFWFFPILNILIPFLRLKAMKKAYRSILTKTGNTTKNVFLEVWAISFLLWYLISIFIMDSLPFLQDDIDFFYLYHPLRLLLDKSIPRLLELIGLFSMYKIVTNIQMLEANFIEQEGEINFLDHLIE